PQWVAINISSEGLAEHSDRPSANKLFHLLCGKARELGTDLPTRAMDDHRMSSMTEQNGGVTPIQPVHAKNVNPRNNWTFGIRLHHDTLIRLQPTVRTNVHRRSTRT